MTGPWEVVVVSSDPESLNTIAGVLSRQGVNAICVSTLGQFTKMLRSRAIGLVLCDPRLSDGSYQDILATVGYSATPKVVVMSAEMTVEERDRAKRSGVFDIISTPCRPRCIEWIVVLAKRAWPGYAERSGMPIPVA